MKRIKAETTLAEAEEAQVEPPAGGEPQGDPLGRLLKKLRRLSPRTAAALAVFFGVVLAVSASNSLRAHGFPEYLTATETVYTYSQSQAYTYIATLKPNIFYRKTTLLPGEGLLYSNLLERVNVTSTFSFDSQPAPANLSTYVVTSATLESPSRWTRNLTRDEARGLLSMDDSWDINLELNKTRLDGFVDAIDEELGVRTSTYRLHLRSDAYVSATISGHPFNEAFASTLTVSFLEGGEAGSHVAFEGLEQGTSGERTAEHRVEVDGVEEARRRSYSMTALASAPFALSVALLASARRGATATVSVERAMAPHAELISEAAEGPPEAPWTIVLASLDDLARTAELLARPILHSSEGGLHAFYTLDGDTVYLYEAPGGG